VTALKSSSVCYLLFNLVSVIADGRAANFVIIGCSLS